MTDEHIAKFQRQVHAFGQSRVPLEQEIDGDRIVIAGAQMFAVPKRFSFHEFLISYAMNKLGQDWCQEHLIKGARPHPLVDYFINGLASLKVIGSSSDGLKQYKTNGEMHAFLTFAYDIFTIADNACIQDSLLRRVRNSDQFQGARFEIFAAASLIRAGFSIEFEDESDSRRSHCEFTATSRRTQRAFSVEAKSRHRNPDSTEDNNIPRAGMYRLLQEALRKSANHERIIFADVNLPPDKMPFPQSDWHNEVASSLTELENKQKVDTPWPKAIIFFTNRKTSPWRGSDNSRSTVVLTAINHPLFKIPDRAPFEQQYPEIGNLFHAAMNLSSQPGEFFGQVAQSFRG